MIIAYDGYPWHGWQMQDNAPTVQEALGKAIRKLIGEDVVLYGAGRTDAGVHAKGQVVLFRHNSTIPANRFREALNSILPDSIVVLESEAAADDFHPQFSAIGKHYRYLVLNRPTRDPFWENRAWHVPVPLALSDLNTCSKAFVGTHDFRGFCAAGHSVKTFDRTIYHASWHKDGDMLVFDVVGSGFLYNMVRIMVGTMVSSALHMARPERKPAICPEQLPEIIASQDRTRAGETAPPDGLYMQHVIYDSVEGYLGRYHDREKAGLSLNEREN